MERAEGSRDAVTPKPVCPRCHSERLDTALRTEPSTGELRKRCCCNQCGHQFWRREGIAVAIDLIVPPEPPVKDNVVPLPVGVTCTHPLMRCPSGTNGCGKPCGHWWCPDCGLSWDDGAEK